MVKLTDLPPQGFGIEPPRAQNGTKLAGKGRFGIFQPETESREKPGPSGWVSGPNTGLGRPEADCWGV